MDSNNRQLFRKDVKRTDGSEAMRHNRTSVVDYIIQKEELTSAPIKTRLKFVDLLE